MTFCQGTESCTASSSASGQNVQQSAVNSARLTSSFNPNQQVAYGHLNVAGLAHLLTADHLPDVQQQAARALGDRATSLLPTGSPAAALIARQPGIMPGLVRLLAPAHSAAVRLEACLALTHISNWNPAALARIAAEPCFLERIQGLLRANCSLQNAGAELLQMQLACSSSEGILAFVSVPGLIGALVDLLQPPPNCSTRTTQNRAIRALADIAKAGHLHVIAGLPNAEQHLSHMATPGVTTDFVAGLAKALLEKVMTAGNGNAS